MEIGTRIAWGRTAVVGPLVWLVAWLVFGPARAGERVVVELGGGDRIEGELVRRDADRIHLLVGGEIVGVDAKRVKRLRGAQERDSGPARIRKYELYSTARRPVRDMQALVEELGPAIAVVKTPGGLGTGWFCNTDGYLVTNHHVVAGERTIRVTMFPRQGKSLGRKVFRKVRIVALNAEMDLALLRIEEPIGMQIPRLYLGDSRAVKVGDKVFAIGNPLGLERSTSQGIVSKVGRNIGGRLFVQTTAPIAPGNSGGPLFNQRGEVIGVVSRGAILLDGLGFAIPSEYVKEFLDNVEAFAYDEDNPNTGIAYMETPVSTTDRKIRLTAADFIRVGHGLCCLNVADLGRDKVAEIVFADNNKSEIGVLRRRARGERSRRGTDDWDINQLPESRRFKLETIPVASRISSIALGDLNGDRRKDVVFLGDLDGLSVLESKKRGGFSSARKIDDVQASGHERAVRIADLDSDGKQDIFVLGKDVFTVFWSGSERAEFPMDSAIRSKVKQFELMDADGDGRLDVVFFVSSEHYSVHLRLQNGVRRFHEGQPLKSQVKGPVRSLGPKGGRRFVTLDPGINRVRELRLRTTGRTGRTTAQTHSLHSLAVESGAGADMPVDLLDADGDGKQEILTADQHRSEFVYIRHTKRGFEMVRSPGPTNPVSFRLHRTKEGRTVLFSFSRSDKLFGVSRVEDGRISFPRPIHTQGPVTWMQLERLRGLDGSEDEKATLLWVEKSGSGQVLRLALADEVAGAALAGQDGSIDVRARNLTFGPDERHQQARLGGKVKRLTFADFDADDRLDLVVFWAYSGKESLYLGLGGGRFKEVVKQQGIIEEEDRQALLVQDLDGDGRREVLQVQPGFVRVLKVDPKGRLYVQKQLNWAHGRIETLAPYTGGKGGARLVAVSGKQARIVRLDERSGGFASQVLVDLTGIELDRLAAGDVDGDRRPDLVGWSKGVVKVLLNRPQRRELATSIALNASMNHFRYFNIHAADLDSDGRDEVLLFDKLKSVMEILRAEADGKLRTVFRHRLFTAQLTRRPRSGKGAPDQPREIGVGDVDGNGKPDLIFVLHDRVAIYLQDGK